MLDLLLVFVSDTLLEWCVSTVWFVGLCFDCVVFGGFGVYYRFWFSVRCCSRFWVPAG